MKTSLFTLLLLLAAGISARAQEPVADTLVIPAPFVTDVTELLKGRVAGVEVISSVASPGMEPTVYIRGVPVEANRRPLYVVDGMRVHSLSALSPEDVESVVALKDGPAMTLYGADAADGVIVVRTRRGGRQGFHASYDFRSMLQRPAWVPDPPTLEQWDRFQELERAALPYPSYQTTVADRAETSFSQAHHLALQYAGKTLSAYAGMSFLDNDAPVTGNARFRRYTGSWSVRWHPLRGLILETTGQYGRSDRSVDQAVQWPRLVTAFPRFNSFEYRFKGASDHAFLTLLTGTAALEFRPVEGLSLRFEGGYSRAGQDGMTTYLEPFGEEDGTMEWTGSLDEWVDRQWGARVSYSFTLGKAHHFHAGLLYQFRDRKDRYVSALGTRLAQNLPAQWDDAAGMVSEVLRPTVDRFLESKWQDFGYSDMIGPYKFFRQWQELSGRLAYDWNGRYSLEAAGFRSAVVGGTVLTPKWAWSIQAGWNLDEEPFVRSFLPSWWTDWKLRGSWGKADRTIQVEQARPTLIPGSSPHFSLDDVLMDSPYAEPLVRSERWEVGTEAAFQADGDLKVSLSLFRNKDDVEPFFRSYQAPYTLRNEGVELTAGWTGSSGPWRYGAGGNLTLYTNRIGIDAEGSNRWIENSKYLLARNGYPVGVVWVYPYSDEYFSTGTYLPPDYSMRTYEGGPMPSVSFGLHGMVGWRNLTLSVSGHGMGGNTIYSTRNDNALFQYFLEGGFPDAAIRGANYASTTAALLDGSFFRIDQVRLGYDLPLRRQGLNVGLYASLENFFLFTQYPGSDPEMALTRESFGLETATFPTSKRVVFGLKVGF